MALGWRNGVMAAIEDSAYGGSWWRGIALYHPSANHVPSESVSSAKIKPIQLTCVISNGWPSAEMANSALRRINLMKRRKYQLKMSAMAYLKIKWRQRGGVINGGRNGAAGGWRQLAGIRIGWYRLKASGSGYSMAIGGYL